MRVVLNLEEDALLPQIAEYVPVHLGDVAPGQPVEALDVVSELVQGGDCWQAELLAQGEVLFSCARGYVHDARSLSLAHLLPGYYPVLDALLCRQLIEWAPVAAAHQLLARGLLQHLVVSSQDLNAGLGEVESVVSRASP